MIPIVKRWGLENCCKFETSLAYRGRTSLREREINKTGIDRQATETERNRQAVTATETDRQTKIKFQGTGNSSKPSCPNRWRDVYTIIPE